MGERAKLDSLVCTSYGCSHDVQVEPNQHIVLGNSDICDNAVVISQLVLVDVFCEVNFLCVILMTLLVNESHLPMVIYLCFCNPFPKHH